MSDDDRWLRLLDDVDAVPYEPIFLAWLTDFDRRFLSENGMLA